LKYVVASHKIESLIVSPVSSRVRTCRDLRSAKGHVSLRSGRSEPARIATTVTIDRDVYH
jgi:hypothetical protein